MLNGLEVRSPFLDINLFKLVASSPVKFKKNKFLLNEVKKSLVIKFKIPNKKRGFNAPYHEWLPKLHPDEAVSYMKFVYNYKYKKLSC